MPLRATHIKVNSYIFLPIFIGSLYFFTTKSIELLTTAAASFLYATLYLSPDDLDMAKNVKLFTVRGVLTFPFRGLSNVLKHRGVSHTLFGPIIKISILLIFSILGIFFYQVLSYFILNDGITTHALRAIAFDTATNLKNQTPTIFTSLINYKMHVIYGLGAIFVADAGHIILDKVKKCPR